MCKFQLCRVQRLSRRAAVILPRCCAQCWSDVDRLTAERMSDLRQMDADLMGSASLKHAFYESVLVADSSKRRDVGDRAFGVGSCSASAQAVAAVADEHRVDRSLRFDESMHHREIRSSNLV